MKIDLQYFFANYGANQVGFNTMGEVRAVELMQAMKTGKHTEQTYADLCEMYQWLEAERQLKNL